MADGDSTGSSGDPALSSPAGTRTAFRLPRTTYLAALFVLVGVAPFAAGGGLGAGGQSGRAALTPYIALLLVPVAVVVFIHRFATIVDDDGITARALFGQRVMSWATVRGLSVHETSVYVVLDDGMVRLPCVHVRNLAALSEAGGAHLPALARPVVKQPPGGRRR